MEKGEKNHSWSAPGDAKGGNWWFQQMRTMGFFLISWLYRTLPEREREGWIRGKTLDAAQPYIRRLTTSKDEAAAVVKDQNATQTTTTSTAFKSILM